MMFRIVATIVTTHNGWARVRGLPTFHLDGDIHGLRSDGDAEAFALTMLRDLVPEACVNVAAMREE